VAAEPIRTLLFSTLYPNAVRPGHGIFVETRLRQLLKSGAVASKVLAPVPWFPFRHPAFGEYGRHAAVPAHETRHGIEVAHPRYFLLPKIGMSSAPFLLARTGLSAARRMIAAGDDFDLIDAHYFYPDGVAAAMIGAALDKPVAITARGSDINLIADYALPRRMILAAARRAAAVVTVSAALRDRLIELGAPGDRIVVLRNGVDLDLFRPADRGVVRQHLGMSGFSLVSVGNLVLSKGHHRAIEALAHMPDVSLYLAGQGPQEQSLRTLAGRLGVAGRTRFLGALPQERLAELYGAADCLVLASDREGWPNVLLEAMACGTPVLAAKVGGVAEIVTGPAAGRLMRGSGAMDIVAGVRALRADPPRRDETRRFAERFGWDATTAGQVSLFRGILRHPQA
jgi:glycosyltransferase involved in cell wall biosynthesis